MATLVVWHSIMIEEVRRWGRSEKGKGTLDGGIEVRRGGEATARRLDAI